MESEGGFRVLLCWGVGCLKNVPFLISHYSSSLVCIQLGLFVGLIFVILKLAQIIAINVSY